MQKKIVLIGSSGVGKTILAQLISLKLTINHIDIDQFLHEELNFSKKNNYSKEEFIKKKELEFNILKNALQSRQSTIISTGEGLLINQTNEMLKKIKKLFEDIENIILILPSQNTLESAKILMKRYNIQSISKQKLLDFEKSTLIFKKYAKKTIYTQEQPIEIIVKKILKII